VPAGAFEVGASERPQRAAACRQAAEGPLEFGKGPVDEVDEHVGGGEGTAGLVRAQQRLPALADARLPGGEGGDHIGLHKLTVPRIAGPALRAGWFPLRARWSGAGRITRSSPR
jgi:hypothetical protein